MGWGGMNMRARFPLIVRCQMVRNLEAQKLPDTQAGHASVDGRHAVVALQVAMHGDALLTPTLLQQPGGTPIAREPDAVRPGQVRRGAWHNAALEVSRAGHDHTSNLADLLRQRLRPFWQARVCGHPSKADGFSKRQQDIPSGCWGVGMQIRATTYNPLKPLAH